MTTESKQEARQAEAIELAQNANRRYWAGCAYQELKTFLDDHVNHISDASEDALTRALETLKEEMER